MPTTIKNLSREDRNTLTSIIKMATYLTGQTCEVVSVRHAISPGLTRYTVKVPRSKVPLAVAPGAKTITLGLNKLADVLATKTLRKLHEGIKIVGEVRHLLAVPPGRGRPRRRREPPELPGDPVTSFAEARAACVARWGTPSEEHDGKKPKTLPQARWDVGNHEVMLTDIPGVCLSLCLDMCGVPEVEWTLDGEPTHSPRGVVMVH